MNLFINVIVLALICVGFVGVWAIFEAMDRRRP